MKSGRSRFLLALLVVAVVALILYFRAALTSPPPTCGPCAGETPVCDTPSATCVACTSDSQCPAGALCNPSGACTRCRGSTEGCPAGQYCLDGAQCVECRPGSNPDCDGNPGGPICGDGAVCVRCRNDRDCQNATLAGYDPASPYCDAAANACVGCLSSADCSGKATYCAGGVCYACDPGDPSSCESGYCVQGPTGPECAPCVAGDPAKPCQDGAHCVADGAGGSVCVACVEGDPARACPAGSACKGGQCWLSCQSPEDCGPGSSTPNCIGGVCVACGADADCAAGDPLFPVCNNGLCVQCSLGPDGAQKGCPDPEAPACYKSSCQQCDPDRGDADCAGAPGGTFCARVSPAGASDSYQCVECVSDAYCAGSVAGRPYCDPAAHACAACDGDHPCLDGNACIGGLCQQCGDGLDCPAGSGTHCAGGQCVECSDSSECGNPAAPYCAAGKCVACRGDGDCGGSPGAPRCLPDGSACVACVDSVDCMADPARYCGAEHTCVACDAAHPCSAPTPVCLGGARCAECASSADCGGKPCLAGNTCGDCATNCDCGDVDKFYCDAGKCAPLPPTCWSWKRWAPGQSGPPPDDAVSAAGGAYLAVIGRPTTNPSWYYFGRTPRQSSQHLLDGNSSQGNDSGNKGYAATNAGNSDGYYWYLAANPGCGRPGPLGAGDSAIGFEGGPDISGKYKVCAALDGGGEHVFSAPYGKNCGPPSSVGAFVYMGQKPRGVNDCPPAPVPSAAPAAPAGPGAGGRKNLLRRVGLRLRRRGAGPQSEAPLWGARGAGAPRG